MCIYCGTTKYRKIYEHHYGSIPVDEQGRSYHIHHIDGKRDNNHPDNLKAVSILEHYHIHVNQKDWAACVRLAPLLGMSSKDIAELASKANIARLDKGSHIFQKESFKAQLPQWSSTSAKRRVENGTNPFLDRERAKEWAAQRIASGVYHTPHYRLKCTERNLQGIQNGTNPFSPERNPSKIQTQCPHCNKIGGFSNMKRWHFDKCKQSPNYTKPVNKFVAKSCPHCRVMCTTFQAAAHHFDKCKSIKGEE